LNDTVLVSASGTTYHSSLFLWGSSRKYFVYKQTRRSRWLKFQVSRRDSESEIESQLRVPRFAHTSEDVHKIHSTRDGSGSARVVEQPMHSSNSTHSLVVEKAVQHTVVPRRHPKEECRISDVRITATLDLIPGHHANYMPQPVAFSDYITSTRPSPSPQPQESIEMYSTLGSVPSSHPDLNRDFDDEVETLQDEIGLGIGKGGHANLGLTVTAVDHHLLRAYSLSRSRTQTL
jgi:hypothetical protein